MPGQNSWSSIPQSVRDALRHHVFERDGQRCQIRGPGCTGDAAELDHIVPRRDGGAILNADNARASCRHCNRSRRQPRRPRSAPPSREW